jgi:hypothetical protein
MLDPTAEQFAKEHHRFLAVNRPDVLAELQASGDLEEYLTSIGETASDRLGHAMRELLNDKEHQELPYLERVRTLQYQEVIRYDLIFQPIGEG